MLQIKKQNIWKCIILTIVTFGIYYYIWLYSLAKNVKAVKGDNSGCVGEIVLLILFYPYNWVWWYNRGKVLREEAAKQGYEVHGSAVGHLFRAFFGLEFFSMIIMQNDFNRIPNSSDQRSETVFTEKSSENKQSAAVAGTQEQTNKKKVLLAVLLPCGLLALSIIMIPVVRTAISSRGNQNRSQNRQIDYNYYNQEDDDWYDDNNSKSEYRQNEYSGQRNDKKNEQVEVSPQLLTVQLNANGGKVSNSYVQTYYGSTYPSLPTPIRDYYRFLGWYTSDGTRVEAGSAVNSSNDHTLVAKWELKDEWNNWSDWTKTPYYETDNINVETKTLYSYPIYRYQIFNRSSADIKLGDVTYAYQVMKGNVPYKDGKTYNVDLVKDGLYGVFKGDDYFNLGISKSSDLVLFTRKNIDQIHWYESDIYVVKETIQVESPYGSDQHGMIISYDNQDWMLDVNGGTTTTMYRFRTRVI